MIGTVRPGNPAPPVFRLQPARAPIYRLSREVEIIGAPPYRQTTQLTPIGQMGTRINILA